jgi:photosystem II stability/assembly factor-like uncharacterized protein
MKTSYITSAIFILLMLSCITIEISAQEINKEKLAEASAELKMRGIGPALMGGRIADIAVDPQNKSTWYIAVGSGGVWKTENRGISWKPIFDHENSYSIGCVTIDPNNSSVIWVGTGENVSGRHVGWGDGIYLSRDAGKSWQNMGLKDSEHIGKIIVDPRNSDVIFVAAEGPLWSSGGDRGLYKSTDAGQSWKLALKIDENTGVTDVEIDPSNPDVMYAAAYQRRRHTWSLLAGGPKSGIFKSIDGGNTWREIKKGLPKGDKGKIGLAVTPADPNTVYATIEAQDDEKGFYRSRDKGESWTKQNSYISGGTGPHYYQEIEASPVDPDLVYQMDVFIHVTRDGGENFDYLGTGREKHSDNHALWIDPEDGKHLICGTDAGLYESYDEGSTWRHFPNLPISQFYKIGLDNSEPFYNIVAGAQDLGTLIGPSRTTNVEGVRNRDWYVPLGADGYDTAFDPSDPDIVYMEIQQGLLHRYDRKSEEGINIQPQPGEGEAPERWNWDSPVLISPHNSSRLYFGSQRLWQSDDRGDSWRVISEDLTTNKNRYELKMIDRVWSADALYDNGAMSKYATLTGISESPILEGLIYTCSDDGKVNVTENNGQSWRSIDNLPKVPQLSFINDIEASLHSADEVFAVVDAHKLGDYSTYIFKSQDRGRSWRSIAGDLPRETIVWVVKQDHVDPNLLFIGTEYGVFYSPNGGVNWIKLKGGIPTIPVRDLEIHKRDDDLVAGTFGRGIYVLDDYSSLREIADAVSQNQSALFNVRDAWWYVPYEPMQAKGMPTLGTTSFVTDNPPFGALFTFYLNEIPKTSKEVRQAKERTLNQQKVDVPFPGWDELRNESNEKKPRVLLLVSDESGQPVRWLEGHANKGVQRLNWDLRFPVSDPVNLNKPNFSPPWAGSAKGPLAPPGNYSAELFVFYNNEFNSLGSKNFKVKAVETLSDDIDLNALTDFQRWTSELSRQVSSVARKMGETRNKMRHIKAALLNASSSDKSLFSRLNELERDLSNLQMTLSGDPIRQGMSESTIPSIRSRIGQVIYGHWDTRQNPTATQKRNIEIADASFEKLKLELEEFYERFSEYEKDLEGVEAPWTPGRNH